MTLSRFPITFDSGDVALAVHAGPGADLPRSLRAMGLTTGVPTIVAVSAGSRPAQLSRLGPLLEKVLVSVAETVEATVVQEGGAGGMAAAIGLARKRRKAGFPLLGVASDTAGPADLDPANTHFVLVPDRRAGIAGWVAEVATAVAGGNRCVALVTAGGEPAWASLTAHVRDGRLVMVVARTGGVADQLAAAVAGRPADSRARALVGSGQVFAVDPAKGAAHVADTLRSALSRPDALGPGGS